MVNWRMKSCPRCGGDMFLEKDLDFWYTQCLQCSYRVELKPITPYKELAFVGKKGARERARHRES